MTLPKSKRTRPLHPSVPHTQHAKSARSQTIGPELEERIQAAKNDWFCLKYKSIRKAAIAHEVPYGTLRRRCRGTALPKKEGHLTQQLLSKAEKKVLIDWICFLALTGHPVSKRTIRPKVQEIMRAKGMQVKTNTVSQSWIRTFLKDHKDRLKLSRGSGLDPKRAQAFNYSTVNQHFKLLDAQLKENDIPWENVYNMDEKGVQLGGGRKGSRQKFFYARSDNMMYKLQSDELQLVTIIDTVCADGTAEIKPAFVFSGATKCTEWFDVHPDILIATSENGWTDDEIGFEWFRKTFIPQATARNKSGKPILLIYDGHGSHTRESWIQHGMNNNIILYCLPPHCTHRLQPLDVGCFGPLQTAWFNRCDAIVYETGAGMELRDVVKEYMEARETAFKETTILTAWRKAGIRPFNPKIFTEADFAPSKSTSTTMHVPDSFPKRLPRAPDASSDDMLSDAAEVLLEEEEENEQGSYTSSEHGGSSDSSNDSDWYEWEDDTTMPSPSEHSAENESVHVVSPQPRRILQPLDWLSSKSSAQPSTPTPRQTRSISRQMSSQFTPTPSTSSTPSSRFSGSAPSEHGIEYYKHQLALSEARTSLLKNMYDSAITHSVCIKHENDVLKRKLYSKENKKDNRRIPTGARVLTSAEGLRVAQEETQRQQMKKRQLEEAQAKKQAKEKEDLTRRINQTQSAVAFSGSLSTKNKTELGDIASALLLPLDGTKEDILTRIREHFDSNPELKSKDRFLGLFSRGKKRAALDEIEDPPLPPPLRASWTFPAQQQCHHPSYPTSIPSTTLFHHPVLNDLSNSMYPPPASLMYPYQPEYLSYVHIPQQPHASSSREGLDF